ncbi:hypothetical protein BKA70DRAFT_1256674 [Coprinopsis sp. MPI-PUGE-AT-0042]|nr:hypothetical protein BKA70DRAFT_1256674 [Coprinopsis sp. MPI-PUGE-AT-0042]
MSDIESFMLTPLPDSETDHIIGNASRATKEATVKWSFLLQSKSFEFGFEAGRKVNIVEVWVEGNPDKPDSIPELPDNTEREKKIREGVQESSQVRMVSEVVVEPEMCDGEGNLSPGLILKFIDEGSAVSLITHNVIRGAPNIIGVSQNMNVLFHHPAPVSTMLRMVSRSLTAGGVLDTCRCDIWDKDRKRLVASGIQSQGTRSKL